jgi:DNA-3-methyladenine glycosylase
MNIVTGPKEKAHAILIRAIEPLSGMDIMAQRRSLIKSDSRLTKGPGSLSKALGIKHQMTGTSLIKKDAVIWLEDPGIQYTPFEICSSPRIGVGGSGEAAHYLWRFFVKNNKYVSAGKTCS